MSASHPRPLLVVTIDGVGIDDVSATTTPRLHATLQGPGQIRSLERRPSRDIATVLAADDVVTALRGLELGVDRRAATLRPAGRSDDAAVRQLALRPAGPAAITFLALHGALRAAEREGPGGKAYLQALARLDARIDRALELLRNRGEKPELAIVSSGPARIVHSCFDPTPRLRGIVPANGTAGKTWLYPQVLEFTPENDAVQRRLHQVLGSEEFRVHGSMIAPEDDRRPAEGTPPLCFAARRGHGFGTDVRGILPFAPQRRRGECGFAVLPWLSGGRAGMHVDDIAVRILARAGALAADLDDHRTAPPVPSLASFPDVQTVLEHHGLEKVEH